MEEQKNTSFFRFEDLRVYSKSLEYYEWLLEQVKNADEFAKKTILMPLLDAAAKVSVNIAEGSSNQKRQFVEYLKFAKSNVRQCVVFTTIAFQNGFFTEAQCEQSRTFLVEMTKMIGAMVVSLQKNSREDRNVRHNPVAKADNEEQNTQSVDNNDYTSGQNINFNSDLNFNY